jgi:soluble lytic murein transglycosylase-like protein
MPKIKRPVALIFAAAALCATPVIAAEAGSVAASPYRLNVEQPGVYRLNAKGSYAPAPEPARENAVSAPYANQPFAAQIQSAAREAAIDPALVHAVIFVESGYNAAARSPKGAIGLMQVLPDTAARYGVTNAALSPEANLQAGTRYLSDLMQLFDNRIDLVLAAYNAGEHAVLRYGQRIPPYRETQLYVPAVLAKYREWQQQPQPVVVAAPPRFDYLAGTRLDPKFLRKKMETVEAATPPPRYSF